MKNIVSKSIIVFSLLVFSVCPVLAADVPMKIGTINLNRAVNESEQGKKAKEELEAFVKSKQTTLDEIGRNGAKIKEELDTKGDILSAEAKKSKEDELARLTREYQRDAADSQGEVRKKETELTRGIIAELLNIVRGIAADEKYTLILENNEAIVIFADKGIDITDRVIKKFDESQQKSGKK
ncbi:MAG TPA: OmpH family outer membrane protein [Dissulfurispiraceae bacterium]|nr:OmpH family outer membrane protein [Dissulfurispiraceae bacterium]